MGTLPRLCVTASATQTSPCIQGDRQDAVCPGPGPQAPVALYHPETSAAAVLLTTKSLRQLDCESSREARLWVQLTFDWCVGSKTPLRHLPGGLNATRGFTSKGNAIPLAHDQSVPQTSQFSLRPPLLGTLRANPDHSSLALISEAGGLFKQKSYSSKSCCRATEGSSWPSGSRHTGLLIPL